jgi:hypothetical protein
MDVNPAALLIATNLFNQRVLIEAAARIGKGDSLILFFRPLECMRRGRPECVSHSHSFVINNA